MNLVKYYYSWAWKKLFIESSFVPSYNISLEICTKYSCWSICIYYFSQHYNVILCDCALFPVYRKFELYGIIFTYWCWFFVKYSHFTLDSVLEYQNMKVFNASTNGSCSKSPKYMGNIIFIWHELRSVKNYRKCIRKIQIIISIYWIFGKLQICRKR